MYSKIYLSEHPKSMPLKFLSFLLLGFFLFSPGGLFAQSCPCPEFAIRRVTSVEGEPTHVYNLIDLNSNPTGITVTGTTSNGLFRNGTQYDFNINEQTIGQGDYTFTFSAPVTNVKIYIRNLGTRNGGDLDTSIPGIDFSEQALFGDFTATLSNGMTISNMNPTIGSYPASVADHYVYNPTTNGPVDAGALGTTVVNGITYLTDPTSDTDQAAGTISFSALDGSAITSISMENIGDGIGTSSFFAFSACVPTIDSDSDGIADEVDLDDDNDGIPDALECPNAIANNDISLAQDTDSNGTPDYLDVDSDGDGCVDAVEGGGAFALADVDANDMLPGGVDAGGIPTAAGGGQTVGDSQDAGVQPASCVDPCTTGTDTDGDGISDACDLDDDNDGIPDVVECPSGFVDLGACSGGACAEFAEISTFDPASITKTGEDVPDPNGAQGNVDIYTASGTIVNPVTGNTVNISVESILFFNSQPDDVGATLGTGTAMGTSVPIAWDREFTFSEPITNPTFYIGSMGGGGNTIFTFSSGVTQIGGNIAQNNPLGLTANFTGTNVIDPPHEFPAGVVVSDDNFCTSPPCRINNGIFVMEGTFSTVSFEVTGQGDGFGVAIMLPKTANCDFDGDGIPNNLDLDSDDDGILDIVEAGGTDTDNDGQVDYATSGDPTSMTDADMDGLADAVDDQDSGSGAGEVMGGTPLAVTNTDGMGEPDFLDIDADDDGIVDNIEGQSTTGYTAPSNMDTDMDGIDDAYDDAVGTFGGTMTVWMMPSKGMIPMPMG